MTEHFISCDWLSVSLPVLPEKTDNDGYRRLNIVALIDSAAFGAIQVGETMPRGRKPYSASAKLMREGVHVGMVFYGHKMPHCVVEITGRGCQKLESDGVFWLVASDLSNRSINVTRFDLAVDLETDISPGEFAAMRGKRWKTTNHIKSETGETFYIGSKSSERQCKVYRYYPPHERAHLLRVEVTVNKSLAWRVLDRYINDETDPDHVSLARDMAASFEFSHELWKLDGGTAIKSWRPDTGKAGTKKWITNVVVPCLERLRATGEIPEDDRVWYELFVALPPYAYRGVNLENNQENNRPTLPEHENKNSKKGDNAVTDKDDEHDNQSEN